MKSLNMVIPILIYILTFICQKHFILQVRQQRKTMTLTNHKQHYSWNWVSDSILQNILSQILDLIQTLRYIR